MILNIWPQRYSGEIPIGSDIIHVSGGDAERDFEDDHLALPGSHGRPLTRMIHFNPENLEQFCLKLRRIYQLKLFFYDSDIAPIQTQQHPPGQTRKQNEGKRPHRADALDSSGNPACNLA